MHKISKIVLYTIIIILIIPIFSSSASNWSKFQNDIQNTGYSTDEAPDTNNIVWTFIADDGIQDSPAIVNNNIYFASSKGTIYCIDDSTGVQIWNYSGSNPWYSSPQIYNDMLFIGGNQVYCINAEEGNLIWEYPVGLHVTSSPAVEDDRVYVGTWNQGLLCLDANPDDNGDGIINHYEGFGAIDTDEGIDDPPIALYDLIWTFQTSNMVISSPAIYEDKVYFGTRENKMYCLYKSNGTQVWNFTINGWIDSSPTIYDGKIYFGSYDDKLYCLNALNGNELWTFSTNGDIRSSPAIFEDKVYVTSYDKNIYCIDAQSGLQVWDQPYTTSNSIQSSPAVADGKVYFGSGKKVFCIDAYIGSKLWNYETGSNIESSPAISNGKMVIGSADKKIYCFKDLPISNNPPNTPVKPTGITNGYINVEYSFSSLAVIDPDGDTVYYQFDWGDGSTSNWLSTPSSSHIWAQSGIYEVKIKAKDIFGSESQFSQSLEIEISEQAVTSELKITTESSVIEGQKFSVTVKDKDTLLPISGASVSFNNELKTTNSYGIVDFYAPQVETDRTYSIIAIYSGYEQKDTSIIILNQKEKKGWIYGTIYSYDGIPIKGVKICAYKDGEYDSSNCALSDSDGSYVIDLVEGTYVIKIEKSGFTSAEKGDVIVLQNIAQQLNFVLETSSNPGIIDENREQIDNAIQEGTIGAELNINKDGYEEIKYADVSILPEAIDIKSNKLTLKINGEEQTGKTIVITANKDVLAQGDFQISYDAVKINQADNFLDVIDPTNDGSLAEYYIIKEKDQTIILISNPHFSEHTITISSIVEIISVTYAILLFLLITVIAILLFIAPVYHFYFKKVKE